MTLVESLMSSLIDDLEDIDDDYYEKYNGLLKKFKIGVALLKVREGKV